MANVFPSTPFGQKASTNQPYTTGVCEATSKVRIPEVHDAATELQSSVERLHSRISDLEGRLASVLTPTPQSAEIPVRREMQSALGSAIADRVIEINKAAARIDLMLDALAV
jgi:hypothetical protein